MIALDGDHYYEALVSWFDTDPPELVRLPRHPSLAGALMDSPQHARLRWFTGGMLRYDEVDRHLLVTDLRLGMTGYHPFRFALAGRDGGEWRLIPAVERWPAERGDMGKLEQLWRRIWTQQRPIPLAQWASELQSR